MAAEKLKVHASEPEEEEEEDLIDPVIAIREQCSATKKCASLNERLIECNARVSSKKSTAEVCTEELFDFLHCRDHCVAEKLFKQLK